METRGLALNSQLVRGKDFRLDGKVAVVTGGGSGIGRAIALKFAAHGAALRILDVSQKDAEVVCLHIRDAGGNASAHACDVTSPEQVQSTFAELFRHERIQILVNNAGVSRIGTVESTTEADFERILRVNVKGFYHCMRTCVGHMKSHGGGVILNMASTAASLGIPRPFRLLHEQRSRGRHDALGGERLSGP